MMPPGEIPPVLGPWHLIASLWRHRELTWQFVWREIHLRHRGSRLGVIWALVNPLSMLALYYFVFGVIYDQKFGVLRDESRLDFALALFLGLSLFHVISETIGWAPALIASNPNFVKKVVFPLEILPVAKIGDAVFHFGVGLVLIVAGSAFGTTGLGWEWLWLPVLVLPLILMAIGLAWALASIGVFLRDLTQVTPFVTTAVLFASAVFYSPGKIRATPLAWEILKFNPLLQIIDISRHVLLWHGEMPWARLGYVYAIAACVMLAGGFFFVALRRSFAEVI
ncbi:MAG: ABC transporter permease [Verrucomicrobia bacterium]|nr:ABC transporter permease [Verrucomicrobiota bacterium]